MTSRPKPHIPRASGDAALIARAIARAGSQAQLARALGVSPVTVWRWIQEPRRLDSVTRFALRALVRYPALGTDS